MPYQPGGGDPISRIRWALQDGVASPETAELRDEELQAAYDATLPDFSAGERVLTAAVACARSLLVRYSRQYDFSDGQQRFQLSQRVAAWKRVVDALERELVDAIERRVVDPDPGWGVSYVGRLP